MIRLLKENLKQAQNRMKQAADKNRTEREFMVGDMVYLRLQPFKHTTVALRSNQKLSPRFFGPYKVIQRIGKVAYKLELPPGSRIHPIFHVSCLKKRIEEAMEPQSDCLPHKEMDACSWNQLLY